MPMPYALLRAGMACTLLLCLYNCANQIPPEGGPRDQEPPVIVAEASTPNLQTNFRPQTIELTFNEWVRLKDQSQQIVVSPPLEYPFEVKLKRRTLIFSFDEREQLRDSATYVINFGTAIQDLTEGNAALDLRFVFATGPVIDSLNVTGQVVDAYTGEPAKEVLFLLYANTADSVVRTERPFYFSRTDEGGRFVVSNVKAGRYRAVALESTGGDYLYQPGERIGFPDSLILVAPGDSNDIGTLRLSAVPARVRIADVDTMAFGEVKIAFAPQLPAGLSWRAGPNGPTGIVSETRGDSLILYYDTPTRRRWDLYLTADTLFSDTLSLQVGDRAAFLRSDTLRALPDAGRFAPVRPYTLTFSRPLQGVDTNRIGLLIDTTGVSVPVRVRIDTINRRNLLLQANWQDNQRYRLILPPQSVTDQYGRANPDTIQRLLTADARRNFGSILFTFSTERPNQQYIVRLLGPQDRLVDTFILTGSRRYTRNLPGLPAGQYRLEIIDDRNRNGRWDPGNYDAGRQPETVVRRELEQLRANWDLEAEVVLE